MARGQTGGRAGEFRGVRMWSFPTWLREDDTDLVLGVKVVGTHDETAAHTYRHGSTQADAIVAAGALAPPWVPRR